MKQLERLEQIRIFDVLRLNEAQYPFLEYIHASMNGLYSKSARMAADRKRQGQRAGVPDMCLPFPSAKYANAYAPYSGAFIELKVGRNKATPEQKAFLEFVTNNGYAGIVANGADEALDFIEEYCGIKLRGRR